MTAVVETKTDFRKARSPGHRPIASALHSLRANQTGIIGAAIIGIVVVTAVFAPYLSPHDPNAVDWAHARRPPVWTSEGSPERILGGDELGRDVLSRLIYGSRVSVVVGLGGVGIAMIIGVLLGLAAAMVGGNVDRVLMRLTDIMLGLPYLLFVMVMIGVLGANLLNVVIIFGIADFPVFARITRGEALKLKRALYIDAARTIGASAIHVVARHVFPNLVNVLIVVGTFELASVILYEAGLGFLGLSVPPEIPSWGNMLADGREYLSTSWWLAAFPGLAILITSLAVNLFGDWLRDRFDPHHVALPR